MDYELAVELKDAGFPQTGENCNVLQSYRGEYCNKQYENYEDAQDRHEKECKDWDCKSPIQNSDLYIPTLSELIEACGDIQFNLMKLTSDYASSKAPIVNGERVRGGYELSWGDESNDTYDWLYAPTPEEAVARLWLALNKK